MANSNAPRGIIPYAYRSGAPYNGAVRTYYVPVGNMTALYIGDPVLNVTNSSDGNGVQTVEIAAAGTTNTSLTYAVLGSFMGVSNNAGQVTIPVLQGNPVYLPAATAAYIYVADDPTLLYWVQESGASGDSFVSGASGRNAALLAGAGSPYTNFSGWTLDSATGISTAAYQMRIVELLQEVDNAVGLYAKWLCFINNHPFNNTTGI